MAINKKPRKKIRILLGLLFFWNKIRFMYNTFIWRCVHINHYIRRQGKSKTIVYFEQVLLLQYTGGWNVWGGGGEWFLAGNQGNHKNFDPSLISKNLWLIFIFFWKKIQNGRLKKSEFFNSANSQKIFPKISQIDPLVSRIDWCKRHWCGSTYMAMRLSNISSKT